MLKKLVLKMVKKYINIYNYKLSLLGRDDTKQVKTVIFNVVPPSRTISKSTKKKKKKIKKKKKKKKKKRCQMLLEPIVIAIINLLNLEVVPDKAFLNYV